MEKIKIYGVELSRIEEMEFSKYLQKPNVPAPNTLTAKERQMMVLDWKKNKNL